jgi:hypothetical protein
VGGKGRLNHMYSYLKRSPQVQESGLHSVVVNVCATKSGGVGIVDATTVVKGAIRFQNPYGYVVGTNLLVLVSNSYIPTTPSSNQVFIGGLLRVLTVRGMQSCNIRGLRCHIHCETTQGSSEVYH